MYWYIGIEGLVGFIILLIAGKILLALESPEEKKVRKENKEIADLKNHQDNCDKQRMLEGFIDAAVRQSLDELDKKR